MKQGEAIYKLVVSIPWGSEAEQIQPQFVDYPNFGNESFSPNRKQYAPCLFRVGFSGNIHLLENGYYEIKGTDMVNILHCSGDGTLLFKTPLLQDLSKSRRQVIDFFVDEDHNCYVLETFTLLNESQQYNHLYKMDRTGKAVWQLTGLVNSNTLNFEKLEGIFSNFLMSSDNIIFLNPQFQFTSIGKFNGEKGLFEEVIKFENGSKYTYIGGDSELIRIPYFPKNQHRGFSSFNYKIGKTQVIEGDVALVELLLYPLGTDRFNNYYIYKAPVLGSITFSGGYKEIEKIENIVVSADTSMIYVSHYSGNTLNITGYRNGSFEKEWKLAVESIDGFTPKLIYINEDSNFYVLLNNAKEGAGYFIKTFSQDGVFVRDMVPPPNLEIIETSLMPYLFWSTDQSGNIYLPIADPHGLKIIKRNTHHGA